MAAQRDTGMSRIFSTDGGKTLAMRITKMPARLSESFDFVDMSVASGNDRCIQSQPGCSGRLPGSRRASPFGKSPPSLGAFFEPFESRQALAECIWSIAAAGWGLRRKTKPISGPTMRGRSPRAAHGRAELPSPSPLDADVCHAFRGWHRNAR